MDDNCIYPAIFEADSQEGGYTITFPDLPGCITEGDSLTEAMKNAREALELHLYGLEVDGEILPEPTLPHKVKLENDNQFINLITAYMKLFRAEMANKTVKKTVTMPKWLNELAEKEKVNFSRILQKGLKERLGISDNLEEHIKLMK